MPSDPLHPGVHLGRGPDDPRTVTLERSDTLLLVVDVQERLAAAMEPRALAVVLDRCALLLRAAARLGLPVVASEQYVRGLGPTVPAVRALLPEPPLEKLEFSCGGSPALARRVWESGRRTVLVCGMETHVCVFQTARDLVRGGFVVHAARDAVLSRTAEDRLAGLSLLEKSGVTLTSAEAAVFDLLGVAGTPEFRDLLPFLRKHAGVANPHGL